jgi:hypothetical protein
VTGQDRISVGCRTSGAKRSNGATGASRILHHKLLAEMVIENVGDDPAGDIGRPAGCERNDDRDRSAPDNLRPARQRFRLPSREPPLPSNALPFIASPTS